ncbi:MAG: hypothetical protein LBM68_06700 [Bacteroidales bacterium]|jgi:hypothetical protein|nr:hypothetical protein [Bacteroidales bacterium]
MIYNEKEFLKAIEKSFKAYKIHGARSTEKLKPIHKFVAETIGEIFGKSYELHFMGVGSKEMTVEGKYYPKDIDITVSKNGKAILCLGIKFVTSNYKQNANNYFENMMGETANIQATQIPYAQLIILRYETPYYPKNETEIPKKIEIINDRDIAKYIKLMYDQPQAHRPNYLGIQLINIDEKNSKVSTIGANAELDKAIVKLLKTKLSMQNFFKEIENYKNYLKIKK